MEAYTKFLTGCVVAVWLVGSIAAFVTIWSPNKKDMGWYLYPVKVVVLAFASALWPIPAVAFYASNIYKQGGGHKAEASVRGTIR